MSRILCITGGIGSGKSVVASILQSLGIPVYNADSRAKALYSDEPGLLQEVVNAFGAIILDERGKLRREVLAAIVFNHPEKLAQLNSIVHPYVRRDFEKWCGFNRDKKVLAREAAILFESGASKDCSLVIAVSAPLETRLERIRKRDKAGDEEILARMSKQWAPEKVARLAGYEIVNDDKQLILPQVLEILRQENILTL